MREARRVGRYLRAVNSHILLIFAMLFFMVKLSLTSAKHYLQTLNFRERMESDCG